MNSVVKKENGLTMIEILIYVAILGIMSGVVVVFIINVLEAYNRVSAVSVIESNAKSVTRAFENEAKFAESVYWPTSVFGVATGQISLKTNLSLPQGETFTYVDFYMDNQKIYKKREGQAEFALTSDNVSVSGFLVERFSANSVRINLSLRPRFGRPALIGEKTFIFSSTLRGIY